MHTISSAIWTPLPWLPLLAKWLALNNVQFIKVCMKMPKTCWSDTFSPTPAYFYRPVLSQSIQQTHSSTRGWCVSVRVCLVLAWDYTCLCVRNTSRGNKLSFSYTSVYICISAGSKFMMDPSSSNIIQKTWTVVVNFNQTECTECIQEVSICLNYCIRQEGEKEIRSASLSYLRWRFCPCKMNFLALNKGVICLLYWFAGFF